MGRPRTKPLVVFGERLHEALRRSDFKTKTALLRELDDVPAMTLHRYEVGEGVPPMDLVGRLADLLGVSADYLMGRDIAAPSTSEPVYDHEPDVVTRAIRYVFGGTWPAPDLEARIRERAELIGFGDGGDLGTLAGVVQRAKIEWEADQAGRAPRTAEGTRVEPPAPREGAKAFRPTRANRRD